MTPKQKLKKLQAKAQFKKNGKNNKHRDKWGKTQQERTKEQKRVPSFRNDYGMSSIYLDALSLGMIGTKRKIVKQEKEGTK